MLRAGWDEQHRTPERREIDEIRPPRDDETERELANNPRLECPIALNLQQNARNNR